LRCTLRLVLYGIPRNKKTNLPNKGQIQSKRIRTQKFRKLLLRPFANLLFEFLTWVELEGVEEVGEAVERQDQVTAGMENMLHLALEVLIQKQNIL
jgi:hypothetical protein